MNKKKIISYTRVSADIFHYGHLRLIEKAKKISDYHICGLYSDELCLKWNQSLVMNYEERIAILNALSSVDEVLEQKVLDPTENLKILNKRFPDSKIIFFQGHQEWKGLPGTNYVKSIGGEIIKPDYYPKLTRSKIIDELNKKNKVNIHDIESYLLGDVSYFNLYNSTKANTLASLKPNLKNSVVEELFIFTINQWEESSKDIVLQIKNKFNGKIVIRSSSLIEDGHFSSYAGFFHSELNVDSKDTNEIIKSIRKVIDSYARDKNSSKNDQILVQSQTKNVVMSGVVFSRNIENNSPYYLINFDNSSITDSVTSGNVGNKLEIIKNINNKKLPTIWKSLMTSVKEIEVLLHNLALDIEFAIKKNGKVVIFQVRPITAIKQISNTPDTDLFSVISKLIKKYNQDKSNSVIKNQYTLSDMSFWNPAEIIGDRSDNLSYSIYLYLILSKSWNKGLTRIGYKKINRNLMVRYGNKPYIEVETAFIALLPSDLNDKITNKLVKFYTKKLKSQPELHDKIEFQIVHNCFSPKTKTQLNELNKVLSDKEIKALRKSLIILTQNIFDNYSQIKSEDLKELELLADKRTKLLKGVKNLSINKKLDKIIELLDDAKKFGTPQFSRMARLAFIGKEYLSSFVSEGIITQNEYDSFFSSIDTVATEINIDFDKVLSGEKKVSEFNKKYGHLRPGTYDIRKLPYSKDPGYFTIDKSTLVSKPKLKSNNIYYNLEKKINNYLNKFEVSISSHQLLKFIEETTKYRESFKFEFTKNLSLALEILVDVGTNLGFDRNMLSHLSVENIKGVVSSKSSIAEIIDLWQSQITGKKINQNIYKYISLPGLIFNDKDFEIIESHTVRPNFITNSIIKGQLINLDLLNPNEFDLVAGKIVLIEKADPGYDWVFSKNIKGLVTRFGGAASHMAIRCAEFDIPAAIGCGEIIYNNIKNKKTLVLDCRSQLITSL